MGGGDGGENGVGGKLKPTEVGVGDTDSLLIMNWRMDSSNIQCMQRVDGGGDENDGNAAGYWEYKGSRTGVM